MSTAGSVCQSAPSSASVQSRMAFPCHQVEDRPSPTSSICKAFDPADPTAGPREWQWWRLLWLHKAAEEDIPQLSTWNIPSFTICNFPCIYYPAIPSPLIIYTTSSAAQCSCLVILFPTAIQEMMGAHQGWNQCLPKSSLNYFSGKGCSQEGLLLRKD